MHSALIETKPGMMPVLITAPHGGTTNLPGVPHRRRGTTVLDQHTKELALAVWQHLHENGGQTPFLVVAEFHRNFIDANRPERHAYEHADAAMHYRAYHGAIRTFIEDIRTEWKSGLLIDLHGQSEEPQTIHLGTMNGRSISELIVQSGWSAYAGDDSLGGFLRNRGYSVHPNTAPPVEEHPHFDGGHTVQEYGSHQSGGLDAVQLEVGRVHRRQPEDYLGLSKDLAAAIQNFCRCYLPN